MPHADPVARRAYANAYYRRLRQTERGRAMARTYGRRWAAKNPDKVKGYSLQRDRLFERYGVTDARYAEMLAAQGGACGICGTVPSGRRLDIDHDHGCCPTKESCGQCVRGLVCRSCNVRLAFLEGPRVGHIPANWSDMALSYLGGPT